MYSILKSKVLFPNPCRPLCNFIDYNGSNPWVNSTHDLNNPPCWAVDGLAQPINSRLGLIDPFVI